MAQIAQDYARNKIDETNLPSSFVAFLKKLYTEFVEFMRRAKLLDQAFAEGKIDAEFERYLSEKIGLSDATMIEREVSRIEGEQGEKSFSIRARDEAYDAAVKAGDEAEQQRIVDEAAKEAGYTVGPVLHGTGKEFTVFDKEKRGASNTSASKKAFWFTTDEATATNFSRLRNTVSQSRIIKAYLKGNFATSDFSNIPDWNTKESHAKRNEVVQRAIREGKDGVHFVNMADLGPRSDVYAVFDSNQIKSADPITRDDAGNVIPLSQRFNAESNDIRFSIREKTPTQEELDAMKEGLPQYTIKIENYAGLKKILLYSPERKREVGFAYVKKDKKDKTTLNVFETNIDFSFRNRGFGQSLYREIAKYAQSVGATTLAGNPVTPEAMKRREQLFETEKPETADVMGTDYAYAKSKVPSQILFSIQSQEQIDRVNKAVADTTQFAEGRMALYERAKVRFKGILAENKDILDALKEGGAAPEKIRRAKLLQGIAELEVILRQLPAEVRGKVGGFGVLARGGTGDTFLANFFRDRVRMIDEQLEKYLSKEYDEELYRVFERSKPKKDKPGEKPKGIGADIQDLFAKVKEAQKWTTEEVNAHLAAIDSRLESEDLSPADEARLTREADLIGLVGGWNPRYEQVVKPNGKTSIVKVYNGKTSNSKSHALKILKETWAKGYYNFILKKIQEKEQRQADRDDAIAATGKDGVLSERQEADKKENGLGGKFKKGYFNLISFDQFVSVLFGEKSVIATRLADGERNANSQKEDATQAKMEEIADFFAKLSKGDKLKGEQLRWKMSQRSLKPFEGTQWSNLEFSETEAVAATMLWMQEDGKRHMEGKYDDGGKPISKWHYNQQFIDLLEKSLSKEAKALRDFLLKKYDAEYDAINKVYKALNGINLPKIENYSPVTVAPVTAPAGMAIDPITGGAMAARGTAPGALRSRGVQIAEPKFQDALQTYIAHTKQMEHWKAYAPFMAEANGILRNRDVQNAIEAKGGKEAKAVLNTWTDLFSQGGVRSAEAQLGLSKEISALGGRAARVALVGRLGTIIIQSTQLGASLAEMPTGSYILRMSKLLSGNLGWKDAFDSPYIQRRLNEMPPIVRQAVEGLRSDRPNIIKASVEKLGRLISGADALFTAGTYAITYDYHLTQAKSMGITSPEEYARNVAERAVDKLAQPTRMGARSVIENTSTGLIRNFWAFASESRKNLGLAAYAMQAQDPARIGRTLVSLVILNSLVGNIIRNAWSDAKDEDDDEWFDEKHWGIKRMIASTMVDSIQVRGIPVLGDAISEGFYNAFNQYQQSGSLVSFASGVRAMKHLPQYIEGDADWEMTFKDIDGILSMGGLFNENIAAAASLSHLAKDAFGVAKTAKKEVIGE
jgi:predicted GNAT family acetyltransferase